MLTVRLLTELLRRAAEIDPEAASLLSVHPKNADGAILLVHYADDKMLIGQMSSDIAFHGILYQIAAAHRMKTECLGSVPDHVKHNLIRVRNSLFLVQRPDIRSASCRNATALGGAYYVSSRRKLLNTQT